MDHVQLTMDNDGVPFGDVFPVTADEIGNLNEPMEAIGQFQSSPTGDTFIVNCTLSIVH